MGSTAAARPGGRGGSATTTCTAAGDHKAREKQAVEYRFQARDLQEKACRDVRQTLAIAYQDVLRRSTSSLAICRRTSCRPKAMQAYRQQFDIGQRTLLDLLDTQNELFEANRAYINARYDEIIAQARTLASMGQLTAALGVARPDQPGLQEAGQDREPRCRPKSSVPSMRPRSRWSTRPSRSQAGADQARAAAQGHLPGQRAVRLRQVVGQARRQAGTRQPDGQDQGRGCRGVCRGRSYRFDRYRLSTTASCRCGVPTRSRPIS